MVSANTWDTTWGLLPLLEIVTVKPALGFKTDKQQGVAGK